MKQYFSMKDIEKAWDSVLAGKSIRPPIGKSFDSRAFDALADALLHPRRCLKKRPKRGK